MIKQEIEKLIQEAVRGFGEVGEIPLEHPENPDHGDYATSVAFALAKQLGKNPQEVAKEIASKFDIQNSKFLDKVEVVGGFVNFYLSAKVFEATLQTLSKKRKSSGKGVF